MPRYEVVLFDADHTLFDFDRAEREALRQTLEEAGLPADGETEAHYLSSTGRSGTGWTGVRCAGSGWW
ncbi:MAG: hypothetical protein ACLS63_05980 [Flavonifractor plautii]